MNGMNASRWSWSACNWQRLGRNDPGAATTAGASDTHADAVRAETGHSSTCAGAEHPENWNHVLVHTR